MNLFILRHGQTYHNKQGLIQGWYNSELNDTGKAQVKYAAQEFYESIDIIFCSDLTRTQQTLEPFALKYTCPILFDWRLRERNYGSAENKHKDQFDWDVFFSRDDVSSIEGAETTAKFRSRITSFLDDVKEYTDTLENILIIAHGGTIMMMQSLLLDQEYTYSKPENASITKLSL
jgi:probable phosphoglycerate mutase